MKLPIRLLVLSLCIHALVVGCTDEALLSPSPESDVPKVGDPVQQMSQNAPRVSVPYAATWTTATGPPIFPGVCDHLDPVPPFGITGEGFARHLGNATFVAISTVDDVPEPDVQKVCSILTAANGDELYLQTTGTAETVGPIVTFSGTSVFTGGTGRFHDAQGTGTYEGSFNFITLTGELRELGTLELLRGRGHRGTPMD